MSMPQNFRTALNGFRREDVVHYLEYLNAKHSTEVTQLTQEADSLREKISRLEDELASRPVSGDHAEADAVRAQLEAALADKKRLEEKVSDLQNVLPVAAAVPSADLQKLTSEKDALEKRCRELELAQQDQTALQQRCADLERITREKAALQERCQELELSVREKEDLRKQCQELNVAVEEKKTLEARCSRLEAELSALQAGRKQELAQQELDAYRRAEQAERIAREKADVIYNRSNTMLTEASGKLEGSSADLSELADQINLQLQQMQYAINTSKVAMRSAVEMLHSMHVETE